MAQAKTGSQVGRSPAAGWRRRVAGILQRFPWAGTMIQRLVRAFQPRFTVGVVGVLLDDSGEHVFLVEHVYHARTPWGLPGGWIERGEDPARTVEREFLEETGLCVRAVCPLIVQLGVKWRRHLDIVFLVELEDADQHVHLCSELLDYRWTPVGALPPVVGFHQQAIRVAGEVRQQALEVPS